MRWTVTFVPGFMQRGDAWDPVAGRLATRYRVERLESSRWTFEERVDELADRAAEGGAIVGYSMGGRLALHAALRQPDALRALVVIGASPGIEDPDERDRRRRADDELAAWIERSPIDEVVARWETQPVFATQPPALVMAQRPGRLAHDPRALARLLRSAGQGARPPAWDRLGELRLPVLLVAGQRDERYAGAARRMARLIPDARVAIVPGAGHAPQLEDPERVATLLLEFLDEHLR